MKQTINGLTCFIGGVLVCLVLVIGFVIRNDELRSGLSKALSKKIITFIYGDQYE